MFEPGQPFSYSVLVPTSPTATVLSLLSLRSGGNYLDGYDVCQVGANSIQITRRYLALLARETEVLIINVYQRGQGSQLVVSGRAGPAVAAAVNLAIGRLLGGVTMAPAAGMVPARPPPAIPPGPAPTFTPYQAPFPSPRPYRPGHPGQPARPARPASNLDPAGRELLLRAQRAREAVLASRVYAENLLEHAADEKALRYHEQEIAEVLQKIAGLRAKLPRGQAAGPMTSAVLDPQQRILAQAQASAESRVRAMERYAAEVKAADAARIDWENAVRLSGLNDSFLDLAARTAADEHAISELKNLTAQAAIAAKALRHSLRQANVAADALALPPQSVADPKYVEPDHTS